MFTIVTNEITGKQNVQRIAGVHTSTRLGAGLGDLNFGGTYTAGDVTGTAYGMEALVYPNAQGQTNHSFNAAGDMNADGLMDSRDLYLQRDRFTPISAPRRRDTRRSHAVLRRGDMNDDGFTNAADIDHLYASFGNTAWRYDLDVDGWPTPSGADQQDVDVLVRTIFETDYGDADLNGVDRLRRLRPHRHRLQHRTDRLGQRRLRRQRADQLRRLRDDRRVVQHARRSVARAMSYLTAATDVAAA